MYTRYVCHLLKTKKFAYNKKISVLVHLLYKASMYARMIRNSQKILESIRKFSKVAEIRTREFSGYQKISEQIAYIWIFTKPVCMCHVGFFQEVAGYFWECSETVLEDDPEELFTCFCFLTLSKVIFFSCLTFSKVASVVAFYSKYTRALTFQNLWQSCPGNWNKNSTKKKLNLSQKKKPVAELPNVSQAQTGAEHDVWEILHRMMADEPQVCNIYAYMY